MDVDAIVVGSGLCGTLAARRLVRQGCSVLLLEGGPGLPRGRLPDDVAGFQRAVATIARADGPAWSFRAPRGFEWHRARAQGGRTLVWGGWMERPPADYFAARRKLGAPWPLTAQGLSPWLRRAEQWLSVRSGSRTQLHAALERLGHCAAVKRECVLPGGRRMWTAVDQKLSARLRCDSPVTRLERLPGGVAVELASKETLSATRVVLAASPIETARIVEASLPRAQRRQRLELADHLIAGAIAISTRRPVTSRPVGAAESSAVIHPDPREQKARFTVEVRGPTPLETLDAEDLSTLGFTAAEARRHSFFVVFAMGETDPHAPRELELMARATDGLGRPLPRFVRRPHTRDERRLAERMNERCLTLAGALTDLPEKTFLIYDALDFSSGGHEAGTCLERLNAHGEVLELPGVFVADGAGVPAATDRHPSLTLAANALRVADAAAKSFRR